MAGFSDVYENRVLDHVMKGTAMAQPTNLYLGLSTADPLDTGASLAEPSGNGYARVNCTTGVFGAASAGQVKNSVAAINFPTATGSWGTITHVVLFDAASGGNIIWFGPLSVAKAITTSDQFSFLINNLTIQLD